MKRREDGKLGVVAATRSWVDIKQSDSYKRLGLVRR